MKEIHLGSHHKSVVESRAKTKIIDLGIKRAMEFEINDEISIFAGTEPIAEGIIKNITITSISSVANELLSGVDVGKMTSNQILESLNERYEEIFGRKITMKDSVSIIEWNYRE